MRPLPMWSERTEKSDISQSPQTREDGTGGHITRRNLTAVGSGLVLSQRVGAQAVVRPKLAHTGPAGAARQAVAELFATPVSAPNEDRCRVQMYSAGQLGKHATQLEQLCTGSVSFAITAAGTEGTNIRALAHATPPCVRDGYPRSGCSTPETRCFAPNSTASWREARVS